MVTRRSAWLGPLLALALLAGCSRAGAPQPPAAPAPPPLSGIYMQGEGAGWALGGGKLYRTTDGGATWTDVTPPGAVLGDNFRTDAPSAAFAGPAAAWVVADAEGAQLFRSADGGKTWTRSPVPAAGAAQLTFLDARRGWLLAHMGAAMHHEAVALLRTADGGATWSQVAVADPGRPERDGDLPGAGIKSGVAFRDAEHGFLTGDQPATAVYLYSTGDGGQTWHPVTVPVAPGFGEDTLSTLPPRFFGGKDGILPVLSSRHVSFYATHDGGATWTPGAVLPRTPSPALAWCFSDAQHGWAVTDDHLHATADGGVTWQTVPGNRSLAGAFQLACTGPRSGLLLLGADGQTSGGRLLLTADGGATWH